MKHRLPGKFSMAIRSTLFAIILTLFTIPWSLLCVMSCIFPLEYSNRLVMIWTKTVIWFLKVICCINYKVEGLHNIPKDKNGIILCKHSSTWETFFVPYHFYHCAIILKRELYWVPFFGWGMLANRPIAINRSARSSAMQQIMEKGKKYLDQGRWLLIFPEGTRIPYGKVSKYKLGGARLAIETGYPVLPIAHNAGKFWPKNKFIKTPGTVTVVFGKMIDPKGYTPDALMNEVKDWIESTIERIG